MSNQTFKNHVPNTMLFQLLDKLCLKNDKYYTFNNVSFKKGVYTSDIPAFISACVPYYHFSKRKYLEKKLTYNAFMTVLRQICNFNKIVYTSQIKYCKSSYDIIYYIYYPLDDVKGA
jgi:hypothetical protein